MAQVEEVREYEPSFFDSFCDKSLHFQNFKLEFEDLEEDLFENLCHDYKMRNTENTANN